MPAAARSPIRKLMRFRSAIFLATLSAKAGSSDVAWTISATLPYRLFLFSVSRVPFIWLIVTWLSFIQLRHKLVTELNILLLGVFISQMDQINHLILRIGIEIQPR